MGVFASYCQACGLPVQQDHYVPADDLSDFMKSYGLPSKQMFLIYRGRTGSCKPVVPFGPEHEWLKEALAVRTRPEQTPVWIEGEVHDGWIQGPGCPPPGTSFEAFLGDGLQARAALHTACWELSGKPDVWKRPPTATGQDELLCYRHQLFDFAALVESEMSWLIVDPRDPTPQGQQSRARILALLGLGRAG